MAMGYYFTLGQSHGRQMLGSSGLRVGLVAFGFLGMGPVTIAVDSYARSPDNAQSVYELSADRNGSRDRS